MPELPEVETVKRALRPHLTNQTIEDITFFRENLRNDLDEDLFKKFFLGKTIKDLRRRSKYLLFTFDGPKWILSHLAMTGSWRICPKDTPLIKHEHISLLINHGKDELRYCDPRRFGEFRLISAPSDHSQTPAALSHLGPEPFEENFTAEHLFAQSRKKQSPVKTFLMDAKNVCGVGNIYASEVLFNCKISPLKKAGKLSKKNCTELVSQVRKVLQQSIDSGGTTIIDFKAPDGQEGWFHQKLNVYGKTDEACPRCENKLIKKITQQGRSSFYCSGCQKS